MAIIGIGCDLVANKRMGRLWRKYGIKFAKRFLHAEEIKQLSSKRDMANFLAKRFAIKEAVVKALGTGVQGGVFLRDTMVNNDAFGRPYLKFSGQTFKIIQQLKVTNSHITVSDEKEYSIAMVVLESQG